MFYRFFHSNVYRFLVILFKTIFTTKHFLNSSLMSYEAKMTKSSDDQLKQFNKLIQGNTTFEVQKQHSNSLGNSSSFSTFLLGSDLSAYKTDRKHWCSIAEHRDRGNVHNHSNRVLKELRVPRLYTEWAAVISL